MTVRMREKKQDMTATASCVELAATESLSLFPNHSVTHTHSSLRLSLYRLCFTFLQKFASSGPSLISSPLSLSLSLFFLPTVIQLILLREKSSAPFNISSPTTVLLKFSYHNDSNVVTTFNGTRILICLKLIHPIIQIHYPIQQQHLLNLCIDSKKLCQPLGLLIKVDYAFACLTPKFYFY